ncbi:MAG TPA: hypothetical protein PKX87_07680 [Alphaproteobacteria bacterium]|nr:hypothetical protein [Alphaproteobacteria bacterium]
MKKTYGPLRPVVNDPAKREDAIKRNLPARFEIKENPQIDYGSSWLDNLRTFESYGKSAVNENDRRILRYSEKHNIDPDLVRAVMFAENARGHHFGGNSVMEMIGKAKSIMPMNIQKNRWSSLIDKTPENMYDPDANIEASTVLLSRLRDRIEKPTPEKVGTLWNSLKEQETTIFGAYIGKVYREKPWKNLD